MSAFRFPADPTLPATLGYETCAALPAVSLERRRALLEGPSDLETHHWLYDESAALHLTEVTPPPAPVASGDSARILVWNAQRGRHPDEAAALLAGQGAAVNLLCELDHGMARTAQRHTARDLAERLGQGYAYAVEFIELGLGDRRERAALAGQVNALGFHGAAILSPCALSRPVLIRLECEGGWFDGKRGERRVGGRIAQAATLSIAGAEVVVAAVHFESHSGPDLRAGQMRDLLEAIERYAPGAPAIIGGDFNTASAPRQALDRPGGMDALLAEDPDRLMRPMPHEPLFEVARAAGYAWEPCNDDRPTQRMNPANPDWPLGRIDWFFARGLDCTDPVTIPAVDRAGAPLSDHDALAVTVRPARLT